MDFLGINMLVDVDIKESQLEVALNSMNNGDKKAELLEDLSNMFSNLLYSSKEGYHRIVVNRKISQWANSNLDLNSREIDQLYRLEENSTQTDLSSVPCKLTIEFGEKEVQQDGLHWRIGHINFVHDFKLKQVTLLVENGKYDGQIYRHIFELAAINSKDGVGLPNFRPEHSGGSNFLPKWFEDLVRRGEIVLCIGDQDSLTPTRHSKSNLMRLYAKLKSNSFVGFATLTPGNAIENNFPLSIVENLASSINKSEIGRLKQLIANQKNLKKQDCMWLYFDIKNGMINPKKLKKCSSSDLKWLAEKYNVSLDEVSRIKFRKFGDISKLLLKNFRDENKTSISLEFEQYIKSDYWKLHIKPWIDPILWFLCGEETNQFGSKTI